MFRPDGIVQRRTAAVIQANGGGAGNGGEDREQDIDRQKDGDTCDNDKETRLTLMEEVLLLGLKEKEVSEHDDKMITITTIIIIIITADS